MEILKSKEFWKTLAVFTPVLGLAGFVVLGDDARHVVIYGIGIIVLALGLAAGLHKAFYNFIDLKALVATASEEPLAAAVVFCGVIYLVTTIISSLVMLLR